MPTQDGSERLSAARAAIAAARREARHLLEPEAYRLLAAYGIPCPEGEFCASADAAASLAGRLPPPLVVKVVSPDVLHKSDAGGVILGCRNAGEVRSAFAAVVAAARRHVPGARVAGAMVCRQAPPGVECIVGALRDAQFGPAVMFGLGGVFVEVMRDMTFRIAPTGPADAAEMLQEIRGQSLLAGARGRPPADRAALADIICRVSQLAVEVPEVAEIDLNPVVAFSRGALVLDARVLLT